MRKKVLVPTILFMGVALMMGVTLIVAQGPQERPRPGVPEKPGLPVENTLPAVTEPEDAIEPDPLPPLDPMETATDEADTMVPDEGEEEGWTAPTDEPVVPPVAEEPTEESAGRITLDLDEVALLDAVKMFKLLVPDANLMYTPSNLTGKVSVKLTNVYWKDALEEILAGENLVLMETSPEVYRIMKKDPNAPEPLYVETFFLKFARVDAVVEVLKNNVADSRAKISPFPSRGAIVVRSTKKNLGELRGLITAIDIERKQVYIEAKFMELDDSAIDSLGINWSMLSAYDIGMSAGVVDESETVTRTSGRASTMMESDTRSTLDAVAERYDIDGERYEERSTTTTDEGDIIETITPTRQITDTIARGFSAQSTLNDSLTRTLTDVRTAVMTPLTFHAVLSALRSESGISIVSNPKIIVANGEPAIIHIGRVIRPWISEITPPTAETAPLVVYKPGPEVKLGVELNVTPTIHTDSNITVFIEPTLTRAAGVETAPNGMTYPIVAQKRIKTLFNLESGKTAAIGGLTETEDVIDTAKVPLLSDIPMIGRYLFSHETKRKQQRETIIFVTVGLAGVHEVDKTMAIPEGGRLVYEEIAMEPRRRAEFEADMARLEDDEQRRRDRLKKRTMNRPR